MISPSTSFLHGLGMASGGGVAHIANGGLFRASLLSRRAMGSPSACR